MVRYAFETVPYYRELSKNASIDPNDIRTADDLRLLPLIDKAMLRENPDYFLSTSRAGQESDAVITSGSSGIPVKIYRDAWSVVANRAFEERSRAIISRICGKTIGYREVLFILRDATISQSRANFERRAFIPVRSARRTIIPPIGAFEDIVRQVNDARPDVMRGYGSFLETLFRTTVDHGLDMHLPRLVIYSGDALTEGGRRLIEDLDITVHSHYRSVEGNDTGFYCEEQTGFHLNDDLVHVRIIDGNGSTVPDGESGEVVISNLINRGTVLLNYRIGDLASMSSESCPCGRNLPLLKSLDGRTQSVVHLANGDALSQIVIMLAFQGDGLLQFQLIQHEVDRFQVKLVTRDLKTYQNLVEDILTRLHKLFGLDVQILPEYCEKLEPEASGKFNPVISHFQPDATIQAWRGDPP
jgi:phenylacetate-CoA ligase